MTSSKGTKVMENWYLKRSVNFRDRPVLFKMYVYIDRHRKTIILQIRDLFRFIFLCVESKRIKSW